MIEEKSDTSRCASCGQSFRCGAEAGDTRCWCFEMPKLAVQSGSASCYCPACLSQMTHASTDDSSPSNN